MNHVLQNTVLSVVEKHAVKHHVPLQTKFEIQNTLVQTARCLESEASPASLEVSASEESGSAAVASLFFHPGPPGSDLPEAFGRFPSSVTRVQSCASFSTHSSMSPEIMCLFSCTGQSGAPVLMSSAPPKMIGRMREKVLEYSEEGAVPLICF